MGVPRSLRFLQGAGGLMLPEDDSHFSVNECNGNITTVEKSLGSPSSETHSTVWWFLDGCRVS